MISNKTTHGLGLLTSICFSLSVCCFITVLSCGGSPKKLEKKFDAVPEKTEAKPALPVLTEQQKVESAEKAYKQELSEDSKKAFIEAVAIYRYQIRSGNVDYSMLLRKFERVLQYDSNMAEAHYNMGVVLENLYKDEQAAEHYKKALKIRPDLTLAAANWGALLARHGKLDMALVVYQRALKKDEKNSAVLLNIAAIYENQKKYDKALKTASEVLVRDPQNVGAYRILASVYYDKGDLDMAHLICLKGLRVKKEDPRLLNTLGLVFLRMKKVHDALTQFRLALRYEPNMNTTRINIAKIALDYKDFRVAKHEFQKILKIEPLHREANIGLGIAMRGLGEFESAKTHFMSTIKRFPRDPVPHFWLGELALKNLSDTKMANREYRTFVEMSGSNLSSNHIVHKRLDQVHQNFAMENKMAEMQRKMEQEDKRRQAREKELADLRKKLLDEAWDQAIKNKQVVPPKKLEGDKLPFVLIPPAVLSAKKSKVRLVGMEFKPIKSVHIGTIVSVWRKIDPITLEMTVPKGLDLGPWDVMITFRDASEDQIVFQGGLWIGKADKHIDQPTKKGKQAGIQKKGKKRKTKKRKTKKRKTRLKNKPKGGRRS